MLAGIENAILADELFASDFNFNAGNVFEHYQQKRNKTVIPHNHGYVAVEKPDNGCYQTPKGKRGIANNIKNQRTYIKHNQPH